MLHTCYIHLTSAPKNLQHNQESQQLKIQVAQTSHHLALFSGVVRGGKVGVIHHRGLLISCCITWDSQICHTVLLKSYRTTDSKKYQTVKQKVRIHCANTQ